MNNESIVLAARQLLAAARTYEEVTFEELTTPCKQDPCPICTAGQQLQTAMLDMQDALSENGLEY